MTFVDRLNNRAYCRKVDCKNDKITALICTLTSCSQICRFSPKHKVKGKDKVKCKGKVVPAQDMKAHRGSRAMSPLTFTAISWQLDAPAASLPARQPKYALEVKADREKRKIPCTWRESKPKSSRPYICTTRNRLCQFLKCKESNWFT